MKVLSLISRIILISFITIFLFLTFDLGIGLFTESYSINNLISEASFHLSYKQQDQSKYADYDYSYNCPKAKNKDEYCFLEKREVHFKGHDLSYTRKKNAYGFEYIPKKESAKDGVVLLGCSLLQGDGLENKDTLGSQFSKLVKDSNIYSMGVSGGAIHHSIFLIENVPTELFSEEIKDVAYFHIHQHILRATGAINNCCQPHGPIYKGVKDEHEFVGMYSKDIYIDHLFSTIFSHLNIVQLLNINLTAFENINEQRIDEYCELINKLKNVVNKRFKARFHFIQHPFAFEDEYIEGRLKSCLASKGISYIYKQMDKLAETFKFEKFEKYHLPDEHPNKIANEMIASEFLKIILER